MNDDAAAEQWVDPTSLKRYLPVSPSIAFVGNASEIATSSSGTLIDEHDVVVRFNRCATKGYESAVGRKLSVYVGTGLGVEAAATLRSRCDVTGLMAVVAITPAEYLGALLVAKGQVLCLPSVAVPHVSLIATLSEVDRAHAERGGRVRRWTTGTYAIYLLSLLLRPSRIFVAGFDLFKVDHPTGHYFSLPSAPRTREQILGHHSPTDEAALWLTMLPALRCPVAIGADVAKALPQLRGVATVMSA